MEFHVIDKKTGKEPIYDGNHIFRESWCKGRLYERDIEGWYISEDGQLALVDDCNNMAYPPPNRYEIVFDEPTVCDIDDKFKQKAEVVISQLRADRDRLEKAIEDIRDEIEQMQVNTAGSGFYVSVNDVVKINSFTSGLKTALQIIDKHTEGA